VRVALVALVAVGVAIGLDVGLGSSSSSGASGSSPSGSAAGKLTAQARQLRTLLAKGTRATYHAKYTLTSSDPTEGTGSAAIEVWHRPPLERQDTVLSAPNTPSQNQMELRLARGLLTCTESAQAQWSCSKYTTALPSGPEAIVDQITSSLRSETVTGRAATVAGNAAECYDVATKKSALSLCVSRQGIPLEVTEGAFTLVITTLDHTAMRSVFTPPAPVGSATTTTTS
jgi:hypothetical protein